MSKIKNLKKRILNFFTPFFVVIFLTISPASAQNINYTIPNPSKYDNLEEVINAVSSLIRPAFLIAFGAMILFGAFTLLTSQGDEGKIETARKTIIAAIIGFVIAVFAPSIVNLALSLFGVEGFT
jgi:hypothetical protein